MRRGRSRTSTIAWGIVLVGGLFCVGVGAAQSWQDLDPVRNSYYSPEPELTTQSGTSSATPNSSQTSMPTDVESSLPTASATQGHASSRPEQGIGTIYFPTLWQKYSVFEGVTTAELRRGVGHLTSTKLPGQGGNAVLAGHRETVFRDIGQLRKGDVIEYQANGKKLRFRVAGHQIVDDENREVSARTSFERLTLVTCYPFNTVGWAPSRYVVTAFLDE